MISAFQYTAFQKNAFQTVAFANLVTYVGVKSSIYLTPTERRVGGERDDRGYEQPPQGITAPEWAVYKALVKLIGEDNFIPESQMLGNPRERGSIRSDFYIPSLRLVIAVQGIYYHYGDLANKGREQMQRIALESSGIKVVYIDEPDAMRNARFYVREALEGRDHSRMGR